MSAALEGDPPESLESLEIELLLLAIERRYGYDFRNYANASLRRRIRRAVEREGVTTISELQGRLLRDPYCMQRFVTSVAVCVTAMFRDAAFYQSLRRAVLPILRTYPFIRVWVAGCATGEEVYSICILLEEEGLYERSRIYATDLSEELLARARAGVYPIERMRDYTSNYQRAGGKESFSSYYVADHKRTIIHPRLRRNVLFSQHNLTSDASFNEFHLVLCRNVMIYFDSDLRDRVHHLLYESLVTFGVLGIGMKESLDGTPLASRYQPLDSDARLFRRVR